MKTYIILLLVLFLSYSIGYAQSNDLEKGVDSLKTAFISLKKFLDEKPKDLKLIEELDIISNKLIIKRFEIEKIKIDDRNLIEKKWNSLNCELVQYRLKIKFKDVDSLRCSIEKTEKNTKIPIGKYVNYMDSINRMIYVEYQFQLDTLRVKMLELQAKAEDKDIPFIWKILFFLLIFLIIMQFIYFRIDSKNRKDEILCTLTEQKRTEGELRFEVWKNNIVNETVEKTKQDLKPDILKSEQVFRDFQERAIDMDKKIVELEKKITEPNKNEQDRNISQPEVLVFSPKTLYANAIINGDFNKVTEQPNDDTVFELLLRTPADKIASFTIYVNAYKRVLKNPDFIDGCDTQRVNNNPSNLQVVTGEARLQDTGKWQIFQKANVKLV